MKADSLKINILMNIYSDDIPPYFKSLLWPDAIVGQKVIRKIKVLVQYSHLNTFE